MYSLDDSVVRYLKHTGQSDTQLLAEANALARELYASQGFVVPDRFQFATTDNHRAKQVWQLVRIAYHRIAGIDIDKLAADIRRCSSM